MNVSRDLDSSGFSIVLLAAAILLFLASSARACPFCNPSSQDLYTITSNSNVVARVEKVGSGKFKIVELLKGQTKIGRVILAGESQTPQNPKATHLLVSTISNPNQPYWSDPVRPLTDQEYNFIKTSLAAASDSKLRDIAARHLGSPSDLISESAFNILATAPLEEVQRRAPLVGQPNLIKWLKNPRTPSSRKSLYLLMALPALKPVDKPWLKTQLFDPNLSPYADHLPSLMAAYAQAAGPSAITEMQSQWLKPNTSTSASFGASSGFIFIGNNAKNPETKEAARQLFRQELTHPERGVFAISTLGEWRDFSVADQIEKLAYQNADTPWVITSATRYFRSFNTPHAQAAIARLQKQFPKIVDSAQKPYDKL